VASLLVTTIALLLVGGVAWIKEGRVGNAPVLTGSTLLSTVVLLMLIGVRRRLPLIPLASMSSWTQFHLYLGLFSVGIYWMHVPAIIGKGNFESWLSILFLLVAGSGLYGIYASRMLPKRMTAVEAEHRLEHLHGLREQVLGEVGHRAQIAQTASDLVGELNEPSGEGVLTSFYNSDLNPFFSSRPSLAYLMVPSDARRRRLLSGLQELDRYLESEGRSMAGRFAMLVRRKDILDYQFAMKLRLRLWLVTHGILSVALLAGGVVHAWMVS
jgi:hypothetical protein